MVGASLCETWQKGCIDMMRDEQLRSAHVCDMAEKLMQQDASVFWGLGRPGGRVRTFKLSSSIYLGHGSAPPFLVSCMSCVARSVYVCYILYSTSNGLLVVLLYRYARGDMNGGTLWTVGPGEGGRSDVVALRAQETRTGRGETFFV